MVLETLLATLHLARSRFRTVSARIRSTFDGHVLDRESERRGGDPHLQGETRVLVDHLWFESPERWLVEAESGPGEGMIVGRAGERGIRNYEIDDIASWPPYRTMYLGGEATYRQVLWEPNIMVPLLWLEPVRELQVARRTCVVARGMPRPTSTDYFIVEGAHQFELAVDVERGVVLRFRRLYDGAVGIEDEVLQIDFDVDLADALFDV